MNMMTTSATGLKTKMGRFMKAVRAGKEVVVTDRDVPVARLVPFRPAVNHTDEDPVEQPADPSAPSFGDVEVRAIQYRGRSSAELLAEDRVRR